MRVVPVVRRRDHDDVDVGALAELAVVVIDRRGVDAGGLLRGLLALVPDVVDGHGHHVALLLAARDEVADVGVHAAAAADKADVEAVVGAAHAARGKRVRTCLGGGVAAEAGAQDGRAGTDLLDEVASAG